MATSMDTNMIVEKWKRNLVASAPTIKAGVLAYQGNPMERAAAKADDYLRGVMEAVQSGKYQQALRDTPKSAWVDGIINKGLQNLSAGVTSGAPKMQNFLSQFMPYAEQVSQAVAQLPKGGVENAKARASLAIEMLSQFKYRRRS